MKTTLSATAIAFVLCVAPGLALAGVIFTDDFNGETPGLNLAHPNGRSLMAQLTSSVSAQSSIFCPGTVITST